MPRKHVEMTHPDLSDQRVVARTAGQEQVLRAQGWEVAASPAEPPPATESEFGQPAPLAAGPKTSGARRRTENQEQE